MSDALERLKQDDAALKRAYTDAGGIVGDGHHHNSCPFCNDGTGFMLGRGKNGHAVWKCYPGKSVKCAPPADRQVNGTIVDFLMAWQGLDSKAACKLALERYGQPGAAGTQQNGGGAGGGGAAVPDAAAAAPAAAQPRKEGKLHLSIDLALDAARFSIEQRKSHGQPKYRSVTLAKYWSYTDAQGVPVYAAARFDTVDLAGQRGKEFVPVHRAGNGWRVGLGEWGSAERPCVLYRLREIEAALAGRG